MTTDPQVTHPPVTHPEPTTPTGPATAARTAEKATPARPARRPLRLPPPKILAAAALVVVALELLVWQVGGLLWGGVIHGVLIFLVGLGLFVWSRWRNRRDARLARGRVAVQPSRAVAARPAPGRSRLARLFGRPARAGSAAGGAGRSGGLLGRLSRTGSAGRRSSSGTSRAGGLLGRLGGAARRATAKRQATETRPGFGRGQWGVRFGPRASAGTLRKAAGKAKPSAVAQFLRGVREGAKPKPQPKKPAPEPKPAERQPAEPAVVKEKPQPPTRAQLVKEAVEEVADATPAPVASSRRSRGTAVGSMRDILAAAEDLAAQMKAYDEEDMHVFVRELPQLGEALSAVEGGIRMMASRAESEWPLAAPVVEALGSVAGDVKAAAGTVGEAKQAVHRENETDIERGEAPRQGERRWNV